MSGGKHTPGPWKVVRNRDKTLNVIGGPDADGDTRKVCLVNYGEEANASLIVAAPDMLEALVAMRDDPTIKAVCNSPLWAKMVNAIAKAEGAAE